MNWRTGKEIAVSTTVDWGDAKMRCRDKQACQNRYERELQQASERLDHLRSVSHRVRADGRPEFERRLDELRGRLNRGVARLEALRRANLDNWPTAAVHADEAFVALSEALSRLDHPGAQDHALAA